MRVLWVEDFDSGLTVEDLLGTAFQNTISAARRNALGKYSRQTENRTQTYDEWREWHRQQPWSEEPELDVCRSDAEFDALVGSAAADRYDAVLLDINLENDFFAKGHREPERGGFWLYNKLVRQGFPSSRIALLTAYDTTSETTDFQRDCERFGHDKLEAHPKGNDQAGRWVQSLSKIHDHYLILRRGSLDGINYCEAMLQDQGSNAIRFNSYMRHKDRNWTFDHATDFLYALRHLLPIRVTAGERHLQLRGLMYVLCREWDSADANRGGDRYYKSLGRAMQLLRNMASHGRLLDDASVGDTALYVLASLRTSFFLPVELQHYELRLMKLVGASVPIVPEIMSKTLAEESCKARSVLKDAVSKKMLSTTRKTKDGKPDLAQDQFQFGKVINELLSVAGLETFDFITAQRMSFVHEALRPDMSPNIKDTDAQNGRRLRPEWAPFDNEPEKSQKLTEAYTSALRSQINTMPAWVKALWEHLLK